MKKTIAAVALIALGTGSAFAADMAPRPYAKAPAMMEQGYNWTGFYIGGNVGGAASGGQASSDPSTVIGDGGRNTSDLFKSGVTGGFQAGYNWQVSPNIVWGFEGDINWLGSKRTVCDINDCASNPLIFTTRTDFLSTIRGRVGYAWDRSLLYVTGGLAIGQDST